MKKVKMFIMLLAVVPMLMVGCKKDGKSGSTSNVKFNMVDAPANFDSLNIDIQSIQVHSTTSGWITLNSSVGVINVLSYVNGSSILVAQGDITAGSIDQIRLVLGSNNSVVVNGSSTSLSGGSSSSQAGLTINASGQLQAGSNYVFTIDFDAAQSVTTTGSSNFQFNPVIRLIVNQTTTVTTGGSTSSSGSGSLTIGGSGGGSINIGGVTTDTVSGSGGGSVIISGSGTGNLTGSLSSLGLASVCLTGSNGSTFCTMTNITGQFSMQAVTPGTYTVTITPTVSVLAGAHTISNVNIVAGQTTSLGVVAM